MEVEYCSEELRKGAEWLKNQLSNLINEYKSREARIDNIYHNDDIYYNIEGFFVLSKLGYPIASEYVQIINEKDDFESGYLFDDVHSLLYLIKMGVNLTENLREVIQGLIKDRQTVRGYIQSNYIDHTGPMRVLILIEPDSESTDLAIKYFINNYTDDYEMSEYNIEEVSVGILAIYEYNALIYSRIINDLISKLTNFVFKDGKIDNKYFNKTCLALQAFSRCFDFQDDLIKEGINWLKSTQEEDGSWHQNIGDTSIAILSLIYLGEGPKVSMEELEKKELFYKQKLISVSPDIVITNPFSGEVDLYLKTKEMINCASHRLFICSRFITEFHAELLKIKKDKPEIDLRIISIDSPQAQNYKGDGKKFVKPMFDILQRGLEGCFKTTSLLHARCIITDNAILISSADLTSEQLRNEFNMGLYTKNPDTVEEGVRIFKDLWDNIQ